MEVLGDDAIAVESAARKKWPSLEATVSSRLNDNYHVWILGIHVYSYCQ